MPNVSSVQSVHELKGLGQLLPSFWTGLSGSWNGDRGVNGLGVMEERLLRGLLHGVRGELEPSDRVPLSFWSSMLD